jgi:hypothetical protein
MGMRFFRWAMFYSALCAALDRSSEVVGSKA